MTDEELIREFLRVEEEPSGLSVSVMKIGWEDSHTPVSEWALASRVKGDASEAELRKVLAGILADEAFFGRCRECRERMPRGWMHSATLCQQCAEQSHGVVY